MKKKELKAMVDRAAQIQEILEHNKALYRELDFILAKLIEADIFAVESDTNRLTLIDNFQEKNTQFRVARFPRYNIQIDKIPQIARMKREKKAAKPEKAKEKKKVDDSFFKVRRRSDVR